MLLQRNDNVVIPIKDKTETCINIAELSTSQHISLKQFSLSSTFKVWSEVLYIYISYHNLSLK
jgi:hypothetical protein